MVTKNKKSWWWLGGIVYFAITAAIVSSCTNFTVGNNEISGRIVDEDTGRPIKDAIVVVSWTATMSNFTHGSLVCYHIETAITDANGRYLIPKWRRMASGRERWMKSNSHQMFIYSEGYGEQPETGLTHRFAGGDVRLPKWLHGEQTRAANLKFGAVFGCGDYDGSWERSSTNVTKALVRICDERTRLHDPARGVMRRCQLTDEQIKQLAR
jgi:hypothetical protein